MADHHGQAPVPFPVEAALLPSADGMATNHHLPGESRIALSDRSGVYTFLRWELSTPLVEELYPWIQVFASRKGANISSLHRQRLKGREIVLTEDPELHMVWDKYKIYIKPIPACLLSHAVWATFLPSELPRPHEPAGALPQQQNEQQGSSEPKRPESLAAVPYHQPYQVVNQTSTAEVGTRDSSSSRQATCNGPPAEDSDFDDSNSEHLPFPSPPGLLESQDIFPYPSHQLFDRKVALGFLRSYAYLIRHPSDLKIALEVGLIPELEVLESSSGPPRQISWSKWALFIVHFQSIPDSAVSKRYHFGHLRLGRLDWAVRLRFMSSIPKIISQAFSSVFIPLALSPTTTARAASRERDRLPRMGKTKPKWYYLQPYWSIPVLLEGLLAYFLFAFATASLVLSAMQVSLAVPPHAHIGLSSYSSTSSSQTEADNANTPVEGGGYYTLNLWRFFWVFSNATIYVSGTMCLGMLFLLVCPYLGKVLSVIVDSVRRRRGRHSKEQ